MTIRRGKCIESAESYSRYTDMNRRIVVPHRSVRGIRLTLPRLALMILAAGTASVSVFVFGSRLLNFHQEMCRRIVEFIGIPASATTTQIAAVEKPITAALVSVPIFAGNRTALLSVGCTLLALVALHRTFPMARSLIFFVLTLLAVSLIACLFNPELRVDSVSFTRLWMATQFALWLALPWVCAFLVMPIEPSPIRGLAWVAGIGIYGFFWSIVRLAFCLGVLHHTGVLFLTGLWFGFGPLADLLYILTFYSMAVRHASLRVWGYRADPGSRG